MPSDMAVAQADLLEQMQSASGESVTYRRGAHSVTITAVPGRKDRNEILDDGLSMATDELEWKIAPEDLVLNTVRVLPERGDEITRTVGSGTHTYIVRSDGNIPAYRIDPMGTCLTVRTKLEARS